MLNVLLHNGRVISPETKTDAVLDVLILDGVIADVGRSLATKKSVETLDLRGKMVVPGFLDMHVHLREPGYEHKETIETGCAAAAAGGFTGVACMPNTNPPIDNESVMRFVKRQASATMGGLVEVFPIAAVTKGREGKELAPMGELHDAGAVAFSDDGSPVANAEVMRRALEYVKMFDAPIIQHAEELSLTKGGAMNEGIVSTSIGMPAMPPIAEELIVARDITLVEYIGGRYHVAHVSTAGSLELIRRAKAKGLQVTCEAAPHHFTLTDEAVWGFDTNTKVNPPLRTRDDLEALKVGLRDGTIDAIASDHAPHSFDEKQVEFICAPFGIIGLETAVALAITELVVASILTWSQLVEKFSVNPRRILQLPIPKIQPQEKANLTLVDPELEWVVDVSKFRSKSKNSPFHSRRLTGRAVGIINNGILHLVKD
jgi:dihydroorotase